MTVFSSVLYEMAVFLRNKGSLLVSLSP